MQRQVGMTDLIENINAIGSPFNMFVLVALIVSVATVISSIAKQIRKYGCHRQDIDLKRELVERGLSADEIERIIAAAGPTSNSEQVNCSKVGD
jgi:hypothetical protein